MNYKYQLIILGSENSYLETILNTFWSRVRDLGISEEQFIIINERNFEDTYTGKCPAFCLYFGDINSNFKNLDLVDKLITDAIIILPIYYNVTQFESQIPEILKHINCSLFTNSNEIEKITSIILEGFALLRNSRKLFISYRRDESRSVAIQLFEEFEKNGFDVFLDTHSIKQGEPFQEELWHRMTDCDVIVVLNTPNFLESKWCKEEIAEANCKMIGVIQLIWPNHTLEKIAELCLPLILEVENFKNNIHNDKVSSQLNEDILSKIVGNVESIRARNLASRQDNIITEFSNAAKKLNLNITLQPERYICQLLSDGKDRIFIPTVGIPQSLSCNQSEDLINNIRGNKIESIYLLYDHISIRDKWIKHLEWLNKYLKVKTVTIRNIEEWLIDN